MLAFRGQSGLPAFHAVPQVEIVRVGYVRDRFGSGSTSDELGDLEPAYLDAEQLDLFGYELRRGNRSGLHTGRRRVLRAFRLRRVRSRRRIHISEGPVLRPDGRIGSGALIRRVRKMFLIHGILGGFRHGRRRSVSVLAFRGHARLSSSHAVPPVEVVRVGYGRNGRVIGPAATQMVDDVVSHRDSEHSDFFRGFLRPRDYTVDFPFGIGHVDVFLPDVRGSVHVGFVDGRRLRAFVVDGRSVRGEPASVLDHVVDEPGESVVFEQTVVPGMT